MDYNQKSINNLKDPTMQNASHYINNQQNKIREFNVNSEAIASFFIEKFISLAITDAKRNEIETKIPSKCFGYVTKIINNFIKMEYLPYDRDDRYILVPNSKKKFIYDNKYSDKIITNLNSNNNINNNLNIKDNVEEAVDNINSSHDKFLNKSSFSNNDIINRLQNDSSMDDGGINKIIHEDADTENQFFKTNENLSNLNFEENTGLFFDNKILGVNDWSICDEPVNYFSFSFKILIMYLISEIYFFIFLSF